MSPPSSNYQDSESVVLVDDTKVIRPGLVGSIPVVARTGNDQSEIPTRFCTLILIE